MSPQINPVEGSSSNVESKHERDPMLECSNNNPQSYNPIQPNKVNEGKDRDYRDHNFGIWRDAGQYNGSCELKPEEVAENAGHLSYLLEE